MPSVADDLRARTQAAAAALGPWERLRQALELGDADARTFAAARRVSLDAARRALARSRVTGRQPSIANARP